MILLVPANTITHFCVEIKRRTISLNGDFINFDAVTCWSVDLVKTRFAGRSMRGQQIPWLAQPFVSKAGSRPNEQNADQEQDSIS
jgi:hypothetical protein